jgi:DNA mismatch endonuclease (patch repair protein)
VVDKFNPEKRSKIMARVKQANTHPEKAVRSTLHRLGYRFRVHRKDLPGNPDIVLPKYKRIVFVHGCFWHGHKGCKRSARPATNVVFWNQKLSANESRDRRVVRQLRKQGWTVLVIWGCETTNNDRIKEKLLKFLST